ncbi:hypothetical protein KL921_003098 [Ogataea angusta]|uniref:Uncharacterized protein n=1 Tax=Pichia angusta TaxID=870730 RepID=A0AAN6I5C4_PICAN|nr:uncharacterized protein KL928_003334 [Ogataea angusta]KAG7810603.1 hypothetical protein KL921_003098 [Ogataea angusta]KAG7818333.1 hypothetical protein KL928_003334 [Ogataea angusta]KAG7824786.1 hypothetical protein KL909_002008 [Ogataea angusta]KAG7829240.1 hypothetical protein KL920_003033 [Ogataea angusta]KAG7833959.1 hypothetical protein KL943_003255 [Ogataea angusta]
MAVTPMKFLGGVSVAALPVIAIAYSARPTFSNAIKSKLDQEREELKKQHEYKTDFYQPNEKQDRLLVNYLKRTDKKSSGYTPDLPHV